LFPSDIEEGGDGETMATSERTIDFLLDQLVAVPGMRTRKMFGEYALYCGEKVVALVCDDQLFVKITAHGKALVGERYAEGFPYPGAKAALLVGAEEIEDHERLAELIRVTAAALPAPRPKTKTKTKTAKKAKTKATTTSRERAARHRK
jgi:DNA transformation protein and related proteins